MLSGFKYRGVRGWLGLLVLFISIVITVSQQQGWLDNAVKSAAGTQPGLYSVSHFVDGDTIAVNMNGKDEKVRFIGVDTPETHKPNTPVQCYGPAAAAYTKNIIGNQAVKLVSDSLSTDRDRYNRLLRYVYLADGTLVNEKLIQNGYGFYYPYFPFSKSDRFSADQATAQAGHKGLWGNCQPTPTNGGGWTSNKQG
jgi:endonuclease YncB( thermonuclease family)